MNQVNIYRVGDVWCYALFIDGDFDHSDEMSGQMPYPDTDEDNARAWVKYNLASVLAGETQVSRVEDVQPN